ncbi:MAG: NAD(P)H-dependent oxidoreductase [Acidobacteriota bacterium]
MKLTVFNGSPRGSKGNSEIIINWFKEGFLKHGSGEPATLYLKEQKKHRDMIETVKQSDTVLLVFPLYTDAMPGIVKKFIDGLEEHQGLLSGKSFLFMVHSGFPEACHSRGVERYLKSLTEKLGADYLGTIVKGGSEGFRVMPPMMTKKPRLLIDKIGEQFARTKSLDSGLLKKLANPERLLPFSRGMYRLMSLTGLNNFYWNGMLKKNGAFNNRFDAPYTEDYL